MRPPLRWTAEETGYIEPLDVAAELTGASAHTSVLHSGDIPGYTVPGLGAYPGTLIAALVGTGLTLAVTFSVVSLKR